MRVLTASFSPATGPPVSFHFDIMHFLNRKRTEPRSPIFRDLFAPMGSEMYWLWHSEEGSRPTYCPAVMTVDSRLPPTN